MLEKSFTNVNIKQKHNTERKPEVWRPTDSWLNIVTHTTQKTMKQ